MFVRNASYGEYRNVDSQTFSTKDIVSGDILYNVSDVTFIIASGAGDDIDVNTYEGVEALLDAYDYDYSVNNITLKDICVVVSESSWGNEYATVVFAYDAGAVTGGYVFFPEDMTAKEDWDKVTDSFYQYNVAYLNGSVEGKVFKVARNNVNIMNLKAGFYTYEIDANTGYAINLKRVTTEYTVDVSTSFRGDANETWIGGHKVADDVVIADVREDVDPPIDDIEELAEFWNDYADHPDHSVKIVYFLNADGEVAVIYVVDVNDPAWHAHIDVTSEDENVKADAPELVNPTETDAVTVTLTGKFNKPTQTIVYTVNGVEKEAVVELKAGTDTIKFDVDVDGDTSIVVKSVTGSGDFSSVAVMLNVNEDITDFKFVAGAFDPETGKISIAITKADGSAFGPTERYNIPLTADTTDGADDTVTVKGISNSKGDTTLTFTNSTFKYAPNELGNINITVDSFVPYN